MVFRPPVTSRQVANYRNSIMPGSAVTKGFRNLQMNPGPMSFAPPPNGVQSMPSTPLAASGTGGYTYAPNRFAGTQPQQFRPTAGPPGGAQPQQPSNQMARQFAQAQALRGRRGM